MAVDKRRQDLAIPYVHESQAPKPQKQLFGSGLPVAAMFMRSKILAWASLFTTLQVYLNEPEASGSTDEAPAWMNFLTVAVALGMTYMDFVAGRPDPRAAANAAASATETVATAVTTAVAETLHKLT